MSESYWLVDHAKEIEELVRIPRGAHFQLVRLAPLVFCNPNQETRTLMILKDGVEIAGPFENPAEALQMAERLYQELVESSPEVSERLTRIEKKLDDVLGYLSREYLNRTQVAPYRPPYG